MATADLKHGQLSSESLKFLDDIYRLMIDEALIKKIDRSTKVFHFLHPEDLKAELDLKITKDGVDNAALLEVCQKVVRYSVVPGHPRNFNLFVSGLNTKSVAGSWLTDTLNCNIHTYESAPVFTLVDLHVVNELCELMGFNDGDGIFVPGSSFGNVMALHVARYVHCGDVNETGLFGLPRLCIFCSDQSHYSMKKAAAFLGFGSDSIRKIKTKDGSMIPEDLEKALVACKDSGQVPLIVVATSGTTVLGSFDPLDELAEICSKHRVWLHADAAWGGGVLFSDKHRHLMKGIERCDSCVWSLHKLIGAQVQCAAFTTKKKGLLQSCNSAHATYLFATDKFYDTSYDIGDKTVQCGRKVDSFKFWMMWKAVGYDGMRLHVDNAFENARYFLDQIKERPGFKLVKPDFQFVNICFWYIPLRLRDQTETSEWWAEIAKIAPKIKEAMTLKGSMQIAYQPLESEGLVNFFRIIVSNCCSSKDDFDFVIDEFDLLGKDL